MGFYQLKERVQYESDSFSLSPFAEEMGHTAGLGRMMHGGVGEVF